MGIEKLEVMSHVSSLGLCCKTLKIQFCSLNREQKTKIMKEIQRGGMKWWRWGWDVWMKCHHFCYNSAPIICSFIKMSMKLMRGKNAWVVDERGTEDTRWMATEVKATHIWPPRSVLEERWGMGDWSTERQ